ncbi:PREDICTED: uncharacterized protein LOC105965783 [Erythranthe guttata]|uniref:uncharacterized protein LOC105965783 n=1 Tax=Erythranthe guttata TaxID=4155 RepID=UPI00064D99ED|nr:PREDICTED: uncharacterized protein LOC105965783 [Erythranthe guttata]|eukprot:XP_012845794.1 PREDICTED: uncharacterized protein LOC105965783 [Erythranthe guttata]
MRVSNNRDVDKPRPPLIAVAPGNTPSASISPESSMRGRRVFDLSARTRQDRGQGFQLDKENDTRESEEEITLIDNVIQLHANAALTTATRKKISITSNSRKKKKAEAMIYNIIPPDGKRKQLCLRDEDLRLQ